MKKATVLAAIAGVFLAGAVLVAQEQTGKIAPDPPPTRRPMLDGPFTHKNLSIYVLYHETRPHGETEYITLEEGVKDGTVVITEARKETVRRLLVTNKSDKGLFLQIGELVSGGKQDRTLTTSLVIPPKSVEVPIPSLCVEQRRWSGGKAFAATGRLAPSSVNLEVQSGSQSGVWKNVDAYKARARAAIAEAGGAAGESRTSSVNEELASREFRKLTGEYEKALGGVPDRFACPIGLTCAINGRITTVDIYTNRLLFRKLFGKLLNAAASEAAAGVVRRKPSPPTAQEASDFIAAAWDGRRKTDKLGYGNVFVRITGSRTLASQLTYRGRLIHSQVLRGRPVPVPVPVPVPPPGPRPLPRPRPRPMPQQR